MDQQAEIGVFGGSGFYEFAESAIEEIQIDTPYGPPSDRIALCTIAGRRVAFLPRHGRQHQYPPHRINFRANLWALKELGVSRIIAPTAVGSLQPEIKPGDIVINDQFVDRTSGRLDTFYDGPQVTHVSSAEPYCPQLRFLAIEAVRGQQVPVHETGTVVVIQGPRFSSKAESRWFSQMGWNIVGMTAYPEAILARELEICYINVSLVTDYDAGVMVEGAAHVEAADVLDVLRKNVSNVKAVLHTLLTHLPDERTCGCGEALKFARM